MAVGDPTGADLASGITDGDTLSDYGDWTEREITLVTPIELTSGIKYAIIVRAATDDLMWSKRIDNPYANGDLYESSDSGSSWTIETDDDCWFKTKASGVEKDDGSFEEDGFNRAEGADDWNAETFTASSTYTISSVVLKLSKWSGTTPGTVTVSIRATDAALPGKPTNPSPTDTGTDITLDETPLSWDASADETADTYEVYFRESGGDWVLVGVAQAGLEWTIVFGTLDYETTYEWRIDATNENGTTTGNTWSFGSISYDQLRISYRLISGGNRSGPYDSPPGTQGTDWEYTGLNNMITVHRLVVAANSKIWYESI